MYNNNMFPNKESTSELLWLVAYRLKGACTNFPSRFLQDSDLGSVGGSSGLYPLMVIRNVFFEKLPVCVCPYHTCVSVYTCV